ncbi:MAG: hypothetical protein WA126_03650 [Thermodesulfovibrionales bacterium]
MGKLIVELSDEIHGELKKKATIHHKTLKEVITDLVNKYLSGMNEQTKTIKETGLCGSWEDERPADEIIKDIKAHRKWFVRNNR